MRQRKLLYLVAAAVLLAAGCLLFLFVFKERKDESEAPQRVSYIEKQHREASDSQPLPVGQTGHATVSGTVRFWGTEDPVSSIAVVAANRYEDSVVSQTDGEGKYELSGLKPGVAYVISVRIDQPNWVMAKRPAVSLKEGEVLPNVDIYVCRPGSISGCVLDKTVTYRISRLRQVAQFLGKNVNPILGEEANKPLQNVKVTLRGVTRNWIGKATSTDRQGKFKFTDLTPGDYEIFAEPPEGIISLEEKHPDRFKTVTLEPGTDLDGVVFSFRYDAISIEGHVTDAKGVAVAGADVVAEPRREGEFSSAGPGVVTTVTDEKGFYQLHGLSPADLREAARFSMAGPLPDCVYRVKAQAQGYCPAQIIVPPITEDLMKGAEGLLEVRATLRPDSNERPAVTDPDVPIPWSEGNTIKGIDFVLVKEGVVAGSLWDTLGKTLPSTRIRMTCLEEKKEKALDVLQLAPDWLTTDADGQFKFCGIPAGKYCFEIDAGELGTQRSKNPELAVAEGAVISDVNVVVEAAEDRGGISGQVVDVASGRAIAEILVKVGSIETSDGSAPVLGKVSIGDLKDGSFSITELSPGTATLEVGANGYATQLFPVQVQSGQVTSARFALKAEGIISGTITQNGEPLAGQFVTLRRRDKGYETIAAAQCDGDGRYEFRKLEEGTYLVESTYGYGTPRVQLAKSLWAQVTSSGSTPCDFQFDGSATVYGTCAVSQPDLTCSIVVFAGSGEVPQEDTWAYFEQRRANVYNLDPGAEYEVSSLEPGVYTVAGLCLKSDEGGNRAAVKEASERVSLNADQVLEVNFNFD